MRRPLLALALLAAAGLSLPAAAQDISTNAIANAGLNFTYNLPPYSMTLLNLTPSAPKLTTLAATAGQFVFQLQGQPDVPYVIQSSTNLVNWISQSTNLLTSPTLNVTNSLNSAPPEKYWRAVWQP